MSHTKSLPDYGGEYLEGMVGQPVYINPILSPSNDIDADLVQLVFNGLFKHNSDGEVIPDLAESYEVSEDKMNYTVHLKKNVSWHDGEPFTAHDVIFTTNLISDPRYRSPLRSGWQGIKPELVDDYTVSFHMETAYAGFVHNLDFGILPKHIWETVEPENFQLTDLKLSPIGTGPYKYHSFQKDSKGNILSYKLVANPAYFEGKPYISKMTFNFYTDESAALDAYNRKEIMGLHSLSSKKTEEIKNKKSSSVYRFDIPRYFAVFINQTKSIPLANDEVREALTVATNRQEIIDKVLAGNGEPTYSPILPNMIGYKENAGMQEFNIDKANEILEKNKWIKDENGFRKKDNVPLVINLVTTDWEELSETAEILKSQWEKIGVQVNVNTYSISDIQQNYIRPREYEALLFGQVLGADPDLYSFWHSNQKKDPGLNLALFGDNETDKLIDDGRLEFDQEKRAKIYQEFQEKLGKEMPAVFIYSPFYIYPVNKSVHGIEEGSIILPSKRFANTNKWYIKTKREWK